MCKKFFFSLIIIFILNLNTANVFSAIPERKTTPKTSSGESCLRKHEQYNKFSCSYVDYGRVSSSTIKKCNKLKKELKNTCERKTLKCNERDGLVCGIYNVCPIGAACFVGPTYKESQNICKLLKDRKAPDQIKRGKCAEEVVEPIVDDTIVRECPEDFAPVCGRPKPPLDIDLHYFKPAPPQLFANSCKLKKAGFVETDFSECKDACLGDKRVCGQPKWSCPDGMMCTMVMPRVRWYDNECALLKDQATLVSDSVCYSNVTLDNCSEIKGEVCGIYNPPCSTSTVDSKTADSNSVTTSKIFCPAAPSTIKIYKSFCEMLKAGAVKVDMGQCSYLGTR